MSKFDTHGGYFAPKDYLRVNEGGSHEENPNGGVQIGVDPEGNPNLLEEGEPVYKDYVYSDNIEAEEQFLVDNNLPKKYTGKLYSKIADDLFSEAEERPLDPISHNGLDVLLGRLADAQEGQKQAKEQKDLEDELANLSPEELDQLEAMLAQSEQGQIAPEQMPMGAVPEEQMMGPAGPMPVEGMPMMASGGFLRTFETGGPKKTTAGEIAAEILAQADASDRASGIGNTDLPLVTEHPGINLALAIAQPGSLLTKALAPSAYRGIINGIANGEPSYMAFAPLAKLKNTKAALSSTEIANINGKIADYGKDIASAEKELAALKKELDVVKKGGPGSKDVIKSGIEKANERIRFAKREQGRLRGQLPKTEKSVESVEETAETVSDTNERSLLGHAVRTAFNPFYAGKQIWNKTAGSGWRWPATVVGGALGAVPATGVWTGIGEGANALIDAYSTPAGVDSGRITPYTGYYADPEEIPSVDVYPDGTVHAYGGKINRFDDDGKKVEGMDVMAVDENGNLIADIEPAIVTAERKMNPYYIPVHRSVSEPFFTDIESNSRRDSTEEKNSFEDKMSQLLLAKSFFSDNDDDKFMLPLLLHSYYNNSHRYDGFSEPSGQMDKMSPEELMRRYYLEKMWESVGEDGVNRYDFGYYAVPPEMVAGNPNYSEQAYATDNDAGSIIGAILAGKISPEDYAGRLATSDYRNSFFDYLAHNGIGYDQIASADKNTLAGWYYDYSRNALGDKEFGRRYRQGLVDDAEQLYDAYKQGGGSAPSYSDEYLDYVRNNNPLLYESYYAPRNNNQVASRMQSGVRANVANIDPSVFDVPITPFDASMISEYVPEDIDVDSVITNNYRLPSGSFSRDDLGAAANFAPLESFIDKVVSPYAQSRNPGGISGTYSIDRNFDLGKYKTIEDLENSDAYNAFTKYVMRNSGDPTVRAYLQALDNGTNHENNVPLLFDENGNLVDNWKDLYYERRYDQTPGIYHLNPEEIYMRGQYEPYDLLKEDMGPYRNANTYDWYRNRAYNLLGSINPGSALTARALEGPKDSIIGLKPGDTVTANLSAGSTANGPVSAGIKGRSAPGASSSTGPLPIWPRYAGAIGSGLLGLYNVFQQPDRYNIPNATPYLPEGRINLQNQVYNPIDQNMIANVQIAQGNATNRVLRNSGLGPSSAAAILAADNNLTGNLGTGFIQAWDANNQRRNAVLAANNQAEAQRAQFDYTVDAARKNILNTTQKQNLQNKLYQQMMNNQAEGDKYTAISNQISNGLQALSGIGQENFAMNQVNSNPTFIGYGTGPNGWMQYNPYYQFWLENKDKIKG